jgi:hypothetical protein
MKLIEPIYSLDGKLIYRDTRTEVIYRRIIGGIAWPYSPKSGYVIVLAEAAHKDREIDAFRINIIAEKEKEGLMELYQAALELQVSCSVNGWVGNTDNKAAIRYFSKLNEDRGFKNPVTVYSAMYAQDNPKLSVYQPLILELGKPNRVILFFGDNPIIKREILTITTDDALKPAEQFPPIAALGYVVAENTLKSLEVSPVMREAPIVSWDLYGTEG